MPSGRRICLRSDENSAKYCSAGITLKNLQANGEQELFVLFIQSVIPYNMQGVCDEMTKRKSVQMFSLLLMHSMLRRELNVDGMEILPYTASQSITMQTNVYVLCIL